MSQQKHTYLIQVDFPEYRQLLFSGHTEYSGPNSLDLIRDLKKPFVYFDDKIHVIVHPDKQDILEKFKNHQKKTAFTHASDNNIGTKIIINQIIKDMIVNFGITAITNSDEPDIIFLNPEDHRFLINKYPEFKKNYHACSNFLSKYTLTDNFYNSPNYCLINKTTSLRILNYYVAAQMLIDNQIDFQLNHSSKSIILNNQNFQEISLISQFKNSFIEAFPQQNLGVLFSHNIDKWHQVMAETNPDFYFPEKNYDPLEMYF